jgi:hypothetical protein
MQYNKTWKNITKYITQGKQQIIIYLLIYVNCIWPANTSINVNVYEICHIQ